MSTAPATDQRRLLDVQALDTARAKVAHAHRSHPTHATLSELRDRAGDLARAEVVATSTLKDAQRAQAKADADVEQVRTRAARDQERLDSGSLGAKESVSMMSELESLARRQAALEEIELETMEATETAEGELTAIREQAASIAADIERVEAEQREALAELDSQLAELEAKRAVAIRDLDEGLMALYEKVRAQTGGLAVLTVRGQRTEPIALDLSLSEINDLRTAPADQVMRSEDGYILVRVDD